VRGRMFTCLTLYVYHVARMCSLITGLLSLVAHPSMILIKNVARYCRWYSLDLTHVHTCSREWGCLSPPFLMRLAR